MSTEQSLPQYAKLSPEEKAAVARALRTITAAGELQPRSADPGAQALAAVRADQRADAAADAAADADSAASAHPDSAPLEEEDADGPAV